MGPTGWRIQVKYPANPKAEWINGHTVKVDDDLDDYALVLVEDLEPRTILMFECEQPLRSAPAWASETPTRIGPCS